jgi:hypothetical protein
MANAATEVRGERSDGRPNGFERERQRDWCCRAWRQTPLGGAGIAQPSSRRPATPHLRCAWTAAVPAPNARTHALCLPSPWGGLFCRAVWMVMRCPQRVDRRCSGLASRDIRGETLGGETLGGETRQDCDRKGRSNQLQAWLISAGRYCRYQMMLRSLSPMISASL